MMRLIKQSRAAPVGAALVIAALGFLAMSFKGEGSAQEPSAPSPVLSVALTQAQETILSLRVPATGNVVAWQEASVGAEADGLRLVAVNVNVGDTVKRGQVLALFYGEIVAAELAEAIASVAQAQAEMLEAEANHKRAQVLDKSGAMSAQQVNQLLVAAMTARARLDAARALEHKSRLRLAQTQVLAPSDGVISSRTATVGAVIPTGQELFRLIEDGRLEWRALVATADIDQLRAGQKASLSVHGQQLIPGTVRMLAPTINTATHNGLVYIDLPPNTALRAGMFARGYVDVSEGVALTLPQRAVMLRDGFHYVMQVGADSIITTKKVSVGRHVDEHIEITSGLVASEQVIESGLGFLSEGDVVRVVSAPAYNTQQTTAADPQRAIAALRE